MSSLRHQQDPSFEEDELQGSYSEVEQGAARKAGKSTGRPGRPRGKGRPKRSSKAMHKRQSDDDEEQWEDKIYSREKPPVNKQQSSIEGYIKIIDYLKKIDYDEVSLQNKMNPYNALTAACFWYAVSAEFYSFDFSTKKNPHDVSMDILEKIQKLPLLLPNRTQKISSNSALIDFENQELHKLGLEMSEKMSSLVPAPLAYRPQLVERKIPVTSVAQDDQFLSSTRAIIYNYIAKKVKNSDKWTGLVASYAKELSEIPPKEFEKIDPLQLPKEEEPTKEVNLFQLLRQQAKKKIQKRDKPKQEKQAKEDGIFHDESHNESQNEMKEEHEEYQAQPHHIEAKEAIKNVDPNENSQSFVHQEKQLEKYQKNPEPEKQQSQERDQVQLKQPQKMDIEIQQKQEENDEKMEQQIDVQAPINQAPVQEQPKIEELQKQEEIMMSVHPVIISQLQHQEESKENVNIDPLFEKNAPEHSLEKVFKKTYKSQDLLLDSILHMPLDKIISILQSQLPTIQVPEIKQSFLPIPTKDPLQFVFQLHPEEERYLEYMKEHRKKKYHQKVAKSEMNIEQDDRDGQCEDAKCQICTDGDYTDDNLIVFCSLCNISLHQRCVGLAKVPAESWVCDVCIAFGPGGINLPCPLCNVKGGAMKRTSIHIDTNLFKQTNPSYHEYSKKCPYNKQKQQYNLKEKQQGEEHPEDAPVKVVRQRGQKQQQYYYDYFVKSTYPSAVPTCHYVWVHYVCAIWVPQCYFQEKNGMISVKGIENIDHKRFKSQCFVCKKNKCGAAVKCQDPECNKYYHPECARKKKVYMEQLNLQKLKYLIFCEEHQPLKITRQIEYKKKKNRQEIIKFARMIEKYIQTYRIAQFPYKLMKSAVPHNFIDTSLRADRDDKDPKAIATNKDQVFLKELIANLSKAKMMTVHLDKVENGYKITNVDTPSKREIRKCLNRYDEFWNTIKNGDSIEENFRRYERIMMENQRLREKLEQFLNGSLAIRSKDDKKEKKTGKKRGKQAAAQVETLIQEEGGIFCVCKKPYEGETDMFECQVCGQWYHFKCLGFIGSEDDAQKMEFTCMKCMKFEQKQKKEERLQRYTGLFSEDSILYLYRPPTPDLLSQEEVQPKNYQEIMEQYKKSVSPSPKKQRIQKVQEAQKKSKSVERQIIKAPEPKLQPKPESAPEVVELGATNEIRLLLKRPIQSQADQVEAKSRKAEEKPQSGPSQERKGDQ